MHQIPDTDPHERLEALKTCITDVGGRVLSCTPLAHPDDPHTIVAHYVRASSPDAEIDREVRGKLEEHHVPTDHLIPWIDPDADEWEVEP